MTTDDLTRGAFNYAYKSAREVLPDIPPPRFGMWALGYIDGILEADGDRDQVHEAMDGILAALDDWKADNVGAWKVVMVE